MAQRGGIGDSGVFGLVGTTVECNAEDRSFYCQFAKVMNILFWMFILIGIFLIAKDFIKKK